MAMATAMRTPASMSVCACVVIVILRWIGLSVRRMYSRRAMSRRSFSSLEIPERVAARAFSAWHPGDGGCHVSTYSVSTHGYAQIGWGGQVRGGTTAHRAAWTHVHGPIPDGMVVDHTCGNRRCVNVDHLRLLSNYENARRTLGRDWPLGECINGHDNSHLVVRSGKLKCRLCEAEWQRTYRRRKRSI